MGETQSTEYTITTDDGDTRWFESLAEARDFIEENEDRIRGRVEKRVWDHTQCGEDHHWCEIDEQKTTMISVDEFMRARR